MPLDWACQVPPPSRVLRIFPWSPTAQPRFSSLANATAERMLSVPLDWACQVLPLSRVLRIVPSRPTAQPRCPSLVNVTASSALLVPLGWVCQESPPSRVLRIVPRSPTAQPRCPSPVNVRPNREEPTVGSREKRFRSIGSASHCLPNRLDSAANGSDVGLGIRAIHPSTTRIAAAAAAIPTSQRSGRKRAERSELPSESGLRVWLITHPYGAASCLEQPGEPSMKRVRQPEAEFGARTPGASGQMGADEGLGTCLLCTRELRPR